MTKTTQTATNKELGAGLAEIRGNDRNDENLMRTPRCKLAGVLRGNTIKGQPPRPEAHSRGKWHSERVSGPVCFCRSLRGCFEKPLKTSKNR